MGKNSTLYIFLILIVFFFRAYGTNAQTLVDDETVSVSAIVGSIINTDGGGGSSGSYQSGVRFSGFAYPHATVSIQKNGEIPMITVADARGYFSVLLPENTSSLFTLFATDVAGRKSTLLNFPTILYSGYLTDISGIRFAPTIVSDKLSVKPGDFMTFAGSAIPDIEMNLIIEGPNPKQYSLVAAASGDYSITIPFSLVSGEYVVKIGYSGDVRMSRALRIIVGNTTLSQNDSTANIPGDCNVDQRVTITDFSILAYWYNKPKPPVCVDTNHDGKIDLIDFSILAYYWSN